MKKIFTLILVSLFLNTAWAYDANWKLHPIFDEEVTHVVETPDYVYFTSRQMIENPNNAVYLSLFRYDKKGDELIALSSDNILSGLNVRDIIYNPSKGYLLVVYQDYDIDRINNDGSVVNIPFYAQTSMSQSKNINSMAVDAANDRVYLATDFGYVALNDKKNEVAESRIYNTALKSFARIGDQYVAIKDNDLISAAASDPRLSIDRYVPLASFDNPTELLPLDGNLCLLRGGSGSNQYIKRLRFENNNVKSEDIIKGYIYNIENNNAGVLITLGNTIYQVGKDGSITNTPRLEAFSNSAAGSANFSEIWNGQKRKGLSSLKKSGLTWNVSRDWMLPSAPATFASTSFLNHPSKGFLMLNFGNLPSTDNLYSAIPFQLSGYKKGRWTNYAPAYTNTDRTDILRSPSGMAVDPNNSSYIYIPSYHNGILRLNLDNPKDIIHLSFPSDPDNGKDGFVVLPSHPENLAGYANIASPAFDAKGNLWMKFTNWDDTEHPHAYMYCWTAEDLKATTSAANVKFPKVVDFDFSVSNRNTAIAIPLLKTSGLLAYANNSYFDKIALLDTNGTPTDTSDDKVYEFKTYYDSDGNNLQILSVNHLWEDPSTGYVWVCHLRGVCYFVPSKVKGGDFTLNRVKVSRNDGTNLADYLLDGVTVNHIAVDADGRKWFATEGAGVVCTSADGREILEEFNTSNSPLPDDVVYGIGYNSENNSLMFSTSLGYAEYFLPASQEVSTKTEVRAYPNPVRPDYSGYVTITDIPQGSSVRITDIKGNLVKDLGVMTGFDMLWDVSDSNFNRVKSGVYHIMVSPSDETSSYSAVGKILIMN